MRLVASGHRHRYADRGRHVWAPSTTIPGEDRDDWSDPRLGAVEFTFRGDGTFTHRLIHTPLIECFRAIGVLTWLDLPGTKHSGGAKHSDGIRG